MSRLVVITIVCTKDSKEKSPIQSIVGEWKLIAYENFELNNSITQSLENSNDHDVIVSIYENEDFNSIQIQLSIITIQHIIVSNQIRHLL